MHSVCTRKRWESSGMCERLNESGSKKQVTQRARAVAFQRLCFLIHWKICLLVIIPKGMFRS